MRKKIDEARVRAAIEAAEQRTSGEIVVSVADWFWGNPERAARHAFDRLGIANTRRRNGVLVFVAPRRRRLIVRCDTAIEAALGAMFCQTVVAAIAERFRTGDLTGGLVHGIELIATQLAPHFPPGADDRNELPDAVVRISDR
jgi:uncharacterized membrane protein